MEKIQLLSTKIDIPPLPAAMVARPRLYTRLDQGLQPNVRLTLLSAPAGYGKTTVLSAWLRARGIPAAWLSIDKEDNDAVRMATYLLGSYQRAYPQSAVPWPLPSGLLERDVTESILIPFINGMRQSPNQQILVIDDYHLIQSQSVHDCLIFMLDHLPPQVQIMLATRADPPLMLPRLRGRGQINELRLQDLRFSHEETETFLRCFKDIDISATDALLLMERTEGWVSGIQLAAASMRGLKNSSAFVQRLSGSHHYIMDYLLEEVLRRQPAHIQRFLLHTSILDRMCAALCESVMEEQATDPVDGRRVLRELETQNLFIIPLDEDRKWYRYHRLFADLLQAHLIRKTPKVLAGLHARACNWHVLHGDPEQAIKHAFAAADPGKAADLIELAAQDLMLRYENSTFLRWVQRLPEHEILARPKLVVYRAWSLIMQGAPALTIEALLGEHSEEDGPAGSRETLDAFLAVFRGQIQEGLHRADLALEKLPPDEIFLRGLASLFAGGTRLSLGMEKEGIRILEERADTLQRGGNRIAAAMILCELAELRSREMRFQEAENLYQMALTFCTNAEGRTSPLAGRALMGLAELALERMELDRTQQLLEEGLSLIQDWSMLNTFQGHITQAMLYEIEGDQIKLKETLRFLTSLAKQFDLSDIDDILVDIFEARINIREGNLQAVRDWVRRRNVDQAIEQLPTEIRAEIRTRFHKYELPIFARLQIAEGSLPDALVSAEAVLQQAKLFNRPYLQMEAELLCALANTAMGKQEQSREALKRALWIGMREGSIYLYIIEGGKVEQLLANLRPSLEDEALCSYVDQLLGAFSTHAHRLLAREGAPTFNGGDPLSMREMDVLHLLPGDLTAQELADELYLSVNTVRSHMKSIYVKLGVHSRHEAVARALELGLL